MTCPWCSGGSSRCAMSSATARLRSAARSTCRVPTNASCCTARARRYAPRWRRTSMTEPGDHMSCRDVVELVNDYLEGVLSPADTELFEEHLMSCEGCSRYLDQVRFTIDTVGRLREHD